MFNLKSSRTCSVCQSQNPIYLSYFLTYYRILARVTRPVPQELLTIRSTGVHIPVLSGSCYSIGSCLCCVLMIIVCFCPFSFSHCIVYPLWITSSDYYWLSSNFSYRSLRRYLINGYIKLMSYCTLVGHVSYFYLYIWIFDISIHRWCGFYS
jgi:hypothetical protein